MNHLPLLETATTITGGGGVSVVEVLLGLLNVLLGALTGAGALLRKRYENEIVKLESRVSKYEERADQDRTTQDRLLATMEMSVAVSNKQNEAMTTMLARQGETLEAIMAQLGNTPMRRTRSPQS